MIAPTIRQRIEGSQIAGQSVEERVRGVDVHPNSASANDRFLDRNAAQVRLDELERIDALEAESETDFEIFGRCD